MSKILEQLNAEQERLEQEQLENCCYDFKMETLGTYIDAIRSFNCEITDRIVQNNLLRMKDMHDFIYSNPTLKGDLKELTWQRYIEIYKTNHAEELKFKIDHDNNPDTEEILVEQALDLLVQELN